MAVKYVIPGILMGMSVTDAIMVGINLHNVVGFILSIIFSIVFYRIDYLKK